MEAYPTIKHTDIRRIGIAQRHARTMANLLAWILEIVESGENFSREDRYGTEHQQIRGILSDIKDGV